MNTPYLAFCCTLSPWFIQCIWDISNATSYKPYAIIQTLFIHIFVTFITLSLEQYNTTLIFTTPLLQPTPTWFMRTRTKGVYLQKVVDFGSFLMLILGLHINQHETKQHCNSRGWQNWSLFFNFFSINLWFCMSLIWSPNLRQGSGLWLFIHAYFDMIQTS